MITKYFSTESRYAIAGDYKIPNDVEFGKYSEDVKSYIEHLKPNPKKTYVLIIAMGAGEAYGDNANNDYFEEKELIKHHKTFEKAKLYRHHINKDPEKCYGDVALSSYNPRMRRVELILAIDNEKAPDIANKAKDGTALGFSMGTKIPYEICSYCGARPKRFKDRCKCLKHEIGMIKEGGKKVYALNPSPNFFDISYVAYPADRIAYSMKKVASTAVLPETTEVADTNDVDLVDFGFDVFATKIVGPLRAAEPTFKPETLRALSQFPIEKVASTCLADGIILKPEEWQWLMLSRAGKADLAEKFAAEGVLFKEPTEHADVVNFLSEAKVDPAVSKFLIDEMPSKSYQMPVFTDRIINLSKMRRDINALKDKVAPIAKAGLGSAVPGAADAIDLLLGSGGGSPPKPPHRFDMKGNPFPENPIHLKGHQVFPSMTRSAMDALIPLGISYVAYKRLILKQPSLVSTMMQYSPALAMLALGLGAASLYGLLNKDKFGEKMTKTSELEIKKNYPGFLSSAAIGFGAPYLYASHVKKKMIFEGKKPDPLSGFIVNNPGITGILGTLGVGYIRLKGKMVKRAMDHRRLSGKILEKPGEEFLAKIASSEILMDDPLEMIEDPITDTMFLIGAACYFQSTR